MSRALAMALIGIMLAVVMGQAWQLRAAQVQAVTEIQLHESRLVAFLQEIRPDNPDAYDSTLLNLTRIRDGRSLGQELQMEEVVVAEQLLVRLQGRVPVPGVPASQAGR